MQHLAVPALLERMSSWELEASQAGDLQQA